MLIFLEFRRSNTVGTAGYMAVACYFVVKYGRFFKDPYVKFTKQFQFVNTFETGLYSVRLARAIKSISYGNLFVCKYSVLIENLKIS
jgi:hypothetical protein